MKIAQIVPINNIFPPKKYGGIEKVVYELSLGLARNGHKVTVYAAGGSGTEEHDIEVIGSSPLPSNMTPSEKRRWEINQFLRVISEQNSYDLIHFHYEPIILRTIIERFEFNLIEFITKPVVCTFHNQTYIQENINYYKSRKEIWGINYIFVSKSQMLPLSFLPKSKVIYNGISLKNFEFGENHEDFLLFVGRITRKKGILEAIKVSKMLNKRLIIVAKVDREDLDFYTKRVKPLIDGKQISYVGEVPQNMVNEYLKKAYCLLFPVKWEEPFGLVMVEALACGTPVIAFKKGSVPEIINNSVNGYIVENVSKMAAAVSKIDNIDRIKCRETVIENFLSERMVAEYEQLYHDVQENSS